MSKRKPILVVTIRDGVVDEAKLFTNVKRAEECYTIECLDRGAKKDDMDNHLDNGYYEGVSSSVCLVHPTIL